MAAVPICSDFGAQKIKSDTGSSSICHEVMGPDAMILAFWIQIIPNPNSNPIFEG